MGAARIARRYLGLAEDHPIPLSIAHGVDFNHLSVAMDVQAAEPLHWACNDSIHRRALPLKPSVLMPHPWLMLAAMKPARAGEGMLVIGPPPGRANDERLLACMQKAGIRPQAILLKMRGNLGESMNFWRSHGLETVTAGAPDVGFYDRLYDLLGTYESIVGCTLSSALFFAAAIDRRCEVLLDYSYMAYEVAEYTETVRFESDIGVRFTRQLAAGQSDDVKCIAEDVLGLRWLDGRDAMRIRLEESIRSLQYPLHVTRAGTAVTYHLRCALARATGRAGFLNRSWWDILPLRRREHVSVIDINEVDIWLHGANATNFKSRLIPYVSQVTEPGWAVDDVLNV